MDIKKKIEKKLDERDHQISIKHQNYLIVKPRTGQEKKAPSKGSFDVKAATLKPSSSYAKQPS